MADIIVDNSMPGTSSTGTWNVSGAANVFGPNSLYTDMGPNTYRWTPTIPTTGDYDVYVWWSTHANRGTAIPIMVVSSSPTVTKLYNETQGGGAWVLHGRYRFIAGVSGYIETNSFTGQASADAVKLVPVAAAVPSTSTLTKLIVTVASESGAILANVEVPLGVTLVVAP